ncbi:cytochrome P450 [Natronococcus jeotgali]|nr:cytochrome P450 [Natronococcus jeotgali]
MDKARLPPAPSGHPVIGHTFDFAQSPFNFVDRATDECGDIYRMELPSVEVYVLAHPEFFEQALVTDIDAFGKTDDFQRVFGNGMLSTEGEQWTRQRGILQPLFHRDRIGGYGEYMVDATQRRLGTWVSDEIRDIESEMQDLTLEIFFATLFGHELQPGEGDDLREASAGLNKWFEPTSWLLPNWIPTPARRQFDNSAKRLRTEVRRLLAEYDEGSDSEGSQTTAFQHETLLSKLHEALEASGQDHLSLEEVEDQMLTMIFAGYETTAAALGFAWYSLALNPDVRQAFHDELDTVLDGRPPTQADVADLDLTNRIVTETLRLYPPIHTIPRQTTQNVDVGEYQIPANEEVHLSTISVHRDERFYDDPLEFRPDRWAGNLEEELPDHAFIPFGGGRRTCVGREFARLEATLVLATIGQHWTLDWAGDDTITIEPEITTKTKNGLPMRVQQR